VACKVLLLGCLKEPAGEVAESVLMKALEDYMPDVHCGNTGGKGKLPKAKKFLDEVTGRGLHSSTFQLNLSRF
jgi:hypothetical protein